MKIEFIGPDFNGNREPGTGMFHDMFVHYRYLIGIYYRCIDGNELITLVGYR